MLFTYFGVPAASQQRVLVFGVLGAIVLRAILIFIGATLIAQFHWLLYVFGLSLAVVAALIAVAMLASPWLAPRPKRASLAARANQAALPCSQVAPSLAHVRHRPSARPRS